MMANQLNLKGGVWSNLADLSGNFGALGFGIVGIFIVSWAVSTLIYKYAAYDEMDVAIAAKTVFVV